MNNLQVQEVSEHSSNAIKISSFSMMCAHNNTKLFEHRTCAILFDLFLSRDLSEKVIHILCFNHTWFPKIMYQIAYENHDISTI